MSLLEEFQQFKQKTKPKTIQEEFRSFRNGEGGGNGVTVLGTEDQVLSPGQIAEQRLKEKGFTVPDIKIPTGFAEAGQDIMQTLSGAGEKIGERVSNIGRIAKKTARGEFNPLVTGITTIGEVAGAFGDISGEAFLGLGKLLMSNDAEKSVKNKFEKAIEKSGAGEALANGYEAWQEFKREHPQTAESIEGLGNIAGAFLDVFGTGEATRGVRGAGKKILERGAKTGEKLRTGSEILKQRTTKLFGKEVTKPKSVDGLIRTADETLKETVKRGDGAVDIARGIRRVAEDTQPDISMVEKWAGIRPDIKKRISGKADQLKTYFDIQHASNLDDTLPTAFDYANLRVKRASKLLQLTLDDIGSGIGQTRRKLAPIQVPIEKIDNVIKTFDDELDKLGLRVGKKGEIIQQAGRPVRTTVKPSLMQTLRNNLLKIKQAPTVRNVIENRFIFDDTINFAKRGSEVSSVVDPISRKIRSELAEINREVVGKTNAKALEDYSGALELRKELEKFTKRKAGSEFLLRMALSGRGRKSRRLMKLLKELTGIDLMDDATMLQIAIELIGNDRSKNLFRQEITKAGLDVQSIMGVANGKLGGILTLFEKGGKFLKNRLDTEKQFLRTAEGKGSTLEAIRSGAKDIQPGLSIKDISKRYDGIKNIARETKTKKGFEKKLDILYRDSWRGEKNKDADELRKMFKGIGFHGTNAVKEIKATGFKKGDYFNSGIYFADTPDVAIDYMKQARSSGEKPGVFAVDLSNLKIKEIPYSEFRNVNKGYNEGESLVNRLKRQKYDGIKSEGEIFVWDVDKINNKQLITLDDLFKHQKQGRIRK